MKQKHKGTRAERELFHLLWKESWACVRVAGSGSTSKPAPDLLASNGKRIFAIECKSLRGEKKYFAPEELDQLRLFAVTFGAEAWLAIRFDTKGWFFLDIQIVPSSSGKTIPISFSYLQKEGKSLPEFLGHFLQKKIVL